LVGLSHFAVVKGQQPPPPPTTLRPGIVIDPAGNTIYAMTPEGVAAIDLASGAKRWTTNSAAKPLAITSNRLISQVEPKSRTNQLELAVLDTTERGAIAARGVTELPSFVRVAIGQTLEGKFESEARTLANSAIVTWRYARQPVRGLVREPERGTTDVVQAQATGAQPSAEGAVQMDLTTGAVSPAAADLAARPLARRWVLETNEKISGAGATQYESADGRHILASERIADDKTWAKYRWTVFERSTNRRVGQFQTHLAFTPFVVRDSLLIYETTPYVRGGSAEPAKLRGVNLATGQETWSVEVRELEFRGPFPP
jgi:hypothetical protein